MKLAEMLPQAAGKALIFFTDPRNPPKREKERITLPFSTDNEFFFIQEGDQFLFRIPYGGIWFGGTDENPFLVRIDGDALEAFKRDGATGFYDFLKPAVVKKYEGVLTVSAKRQGDIFALPLPYYNWDGLRDPIFGILGLEVKPTTQALNKEKELSVFGTRHFLRRGHYFEVNKGGPAPMLLADGLLAAPDHTPLELNGLHLLVQAAGLYNPAEAD